MKECGAQHVPSLDSLRKTQQSLRQTCGVPTIKCVSPMGNTFYINDPRSIIAKVSKIRLLLVVNEYQDIQ